MTDTRWLHFAEFRLHPAQRILCRGDSAVELGSRATDVLIALIARGGAIVSKTDIMAEVWGTTNVEDNNLTTQIAAVRRALGDTGGARFIQTVPSRGYRFVAEITRPESRAQASAAPAVPAETGRGSLPLQSSSFIGRARELADIRARLEKRALVTLVGAGGVGKTRTALQLAGEVASGFADGVRLLELAPLPQDAQVAEALCRLLGVSAADDRSAEAAAVAMLCGCTLLLIMDNCEHVLQGAASLAAAILRSCPHVRLLATSREALGVPGEAVFPMPSLEVPKAGEVLSAQAALNCDSVRLFIERAADALGHYELSDEDAPFVATICRRLDGVPLATELAAARLRMLKPREIALRLEDVFRLLTGGSRTALPRQQTLRATIDWSHSLLSPAEQIVLRRLSVFADGCTEEGATAVAGGEGIDPDEVLDLVGGLVAKSLMVADVSGRETRYRMLETTRQYAAEKLAGAGEGGRARHMAEYMLRVFMRAEAAWPVTGTDAWLAIFGPEAGNFRHAVDLTFDDARRETASPGLGIALVAHAGALADEMSLDLDMARWTRAAQAHLAPDTPAIEVARLLFLRTMQQKRLGHGEVAGERLEAIALFRLLGDGLWLSRSLRQTAIARAMPGRDNTEALAMLAEAVALLADQAPHKDLAAALAHTGSVHFLNGDHEAAHGFNERALAMRRALGDRSGTLASVVNLAEQLFLDGQQEAALVYAGQAEAEARAAGALGTLALILCNLAGYRLASGEVDSAGKAACEGLKLSRALGQDYLAVQCLEHLALACALSGQSAQAARLLGFTQAHYARTGQVRERLEQAGYDRLVGVLARSAPAAQVNGLLAEGAHWTAEQADAAIDEPAGAVMLTI